MLLNIKTSKNHHKKREILFGHYFYKFDDNFHLLLIIITIDQMSSLDIFYEPR